MEPEQQNKDVASKQIKGTIHQNYFLGKLSSLVFFYVKKTNKMWELAFNFHGGFLSCSEFSKYFK